MRSAATRRSPVFPVFPSYYSAASNGAPPRPHPAAHKRALNTPCAIAAVFFSPRIGPIGPRTVYTFASKIGSSRVPAREKQETRGNLGEISGGCGRAPSFMAHFVSQRLYVHTAGCALGCNKEGETQAWAEILRGSSWRRRRTRYYKAPRDAAAAAPASFEPRLKPTERGSRDETGGVSCSLPASYWRRAHPPIW